MSSSISPQRFTSKQAGLPNAAREHLCQQGREVVARVVDALFAADIEPGRRFTEAEALAAVARFGVGRRALRLALADRQIFRLARVRRNIDRRGRPPQQYEMPTTTEICSRLGVKHGKADKLDVGDFRRGRYKLALHRLLLARRPGQYLVAWLAERISVSTRTIRRFHRLLRVIVEEQFRRVDLRPQEIPLLPDVATPGRRWLEAGRRKFPAASPVAAMLAHMRVHVEMVEQLPNSYSLPAAYSLPY